MKRAIWDPAALVFRHGSEIVGRIEHLGRGDWLPSHGDSRYNGPRLRVLGDALAWLEEGLRAEEYEPVREEKEGVTRRIEIEELPGYRAACVTRRDGLLGTEREVWEVWDPSGAFVTADGSRAAAVERARRKLLGRPS